MQSKTKLSLFIFSLFTGICLHASPRFSVAGFYPLENTGRTVYSMNPGWQFYKGDIPEAFKKEFDDTNWEIVSLPNSIEELPVEASGCVNYQGVVWYRKHFEAPRDLKGKKLFLHFEAIMGKCRVWINGKFVKEHFGGYLPVIIDATPYLSFESENIIAVAADNSDDADYPPGKPQKTLDFAYFGGIYRDCWLIAHNSVFITDANYENKIAGGGVIVSFDKVSKQKAFVNITAHIKNETTAPFQGKVRYELFDAKKNKVAFGQEAIKIGQNTDYMASVGLTVNRPHLWSPETPYLYNLHITVVDKSGKTIDGYRKRVGIRSIEFKGKGGFWLNGEPYGKPIIGANRHQDFAVVGNALSNSLHWRDAVKLRRAGLKVIRNAHYPQDPAFMDACDELGLFVIVTTPGWQFWNEKPIFEQRVYEDIRNMVRRDRNHPSVWLWEPILNETWYPDYFAKKVKEIVEEEYPYPYCYTACDLQAKGSEHFPVLYMHPIIGDQDKVERAKNYDENKTYFTREWGDNVDDWNSHNSPSRVSREWGETPMLVQAQHYANPYYAYTCYETLFKQTPQHMGGCLWHPFDHQRGYHPDPFYGGIMDAFRQPKLSYYMFASQRNPKEKPDSNEIGAMVHIANAMTPFSPQNVTVYSNCDEIRLTASKGNTPMVYKKEKRENGMPAPVITFEKAFDVMQDKKLSREKRQQDSYLLAEGYIDGKKVAEHKVYPARRPSKLLLWSDNEGMPLQANGSDLVTLIAAVADDNENIKRLNNAYIYFTVEGEGELIDDASEMLNPVPVHWGTAPILLRTTTQSGTIKVKASILKNGEHLPLDAEIVVQSVSPDYPIILSSKKITNKNKPDKLHKIMQSNDCEKEIQKLKQEINHLKLKEVSKQQGEFGEDM